MTGAGPRGRRGVVACGALGLALVGCQRRREAAPAAAVVPGGVPVVRGPITLDGALHEPDWNTLARFAVFAADGGEARPYSQLRLLRDDRTLYLGLYAADEDIRSSDAFELAIGALAFTIDPRGRLAPPIDGARVATEIEDTLDDPRDDDEEWVIEAAIPLAALPAGATTIHAARCDTPKDGRKRCGSWDGPLAVPPGR